MAVGVTDSEHQFLYSPNSTIFGKTLQRIVAEWNTAFLRLPFRSNPAFGGDGENSTRSINLQTDANLWYLIGSVDSKPKKRQIRVPIGRPLLIPLVTRDSVQLPDNLTTQEDILKLYEDARKYKNKIDSKTLRLEIDGCEFGPETLMKYYVESDPFSVTIPQDNAYKHDDEPIDGELEDKVVIGVTTGIFVIAKPLVVQKDPHTISFHAEHDRYQGETRFTVDIKYEIQVVADFSSTFPGLLP
jgi:hypothetical protein